MSGRKKGFISAAIRELIPLSEVADYLSISRPTLYKYMEFYDSEEFEKIPSPTKNFFDFIFSENISRKDIHEYFLQKGKNTGSRRESVTEDSDDWTSGNLPTLCIGWNGIAMVLFKDAFPNPKFTKLTAYTEKNGELITVGTYMPEPDMKFITVNNLIPKLSYSYVVEQRFNDITEKSALSKLKLR